MKISRVLIKNYRSIKHVTFSPGEFTAFVGPNNAGKTNILSALNFVLGERYPMPNGLDVTDYYGREPNDDIHIQAWFEQNPQANQRNIESISFCSPEQGGTPRAWYKTVGFDRPSYLSNEIRELCPLVYLDAGRSYESSFGHSKWSLFGRIIRQLGEDFNRTVDPATRQELEQHLEDAHGILRTPLYTNFELQVKTAFEAQLKGTTHTISFDFKSFDPLNFYKSLYPTLSENGSSRNPSEAGSGMRNLIVLALFRAYGEVFRGNAIIAIEEPEIYLHPHAQRSLNSLFELLASQGAQLFMSTHSPAFLSPERSDRVVLVKQCLDDEEDLCTQIKHVTAQKLLTLRRQLHNMPTITVESMRERYRNICSIEHCEAFFSACVVLVEGPTERAALPVYAKHLGLDFNEFGISIVSAGGKANIDSLFHLYSSLEIPVFTVFDNDRNLRPDDQAVNSILLRMLGLQPVTVPDAVCADRYCILEQDYESSVAADLSAVAPGRYAALKQAAVAELGSTGKAIIARYMARKLTQDGLVPNCVQHIVVALERIVRPGPANADVPDPDPDVSPFDEDDIPW